MVMQSPCYDATHDLKNKLCLFRATLNARTFSACFCPGLSVCLIFFQRRSAPLPQREGGSLNGSLTTMRCS